MAANNLTGFLLSRGMVSAGISLAMLSSPDIFFREVCDGNDDKSRDEGARLDSIISVALLLSRPFSGAVTDSFGRKPVLVLGCLLSGVVRILAARNPKSLSVYTLYRTINACAVAPVMLAATAFASDSFGGRASPDFARFSRRLAIGLALVRIGFARFAVKSKHSSVYMMEFAGKMSIAAAVGFMLFTRETLVVKKAFSAKKAVSSSVNYFFTTKFRRSIGLVLALRAMASYCQSAAAEHRRREFKWGVEERSQLSIAGDAAEILVPLIVVEGLGIEILSLEWSLRMSALTLLITSYTPWPKLILANPFLDSIIQGNRQLNALLESVKSKNDGEGQIETALSSFDFPMAVTLPLIYAKMSQWAGTRAPLVFAALALLVDAQWAVPRAKKLCNV